MMEMLHILIWVLVIHLLKLNNYIPISLYVNFAILNITL